MIFWVEMQKARRRHDLLLCLLVPLDHPCCGSAACRRKAKRSWPTDTARCFTACRSFILILLPVAMAALASRLWDMEVKGGTMKLLYTLQSRRSLLMGKAVFGLLETGR